MRVINLHDEITWHGRDYNGKELRLAPGEVCEMSERRAKKLFEDYPGRFRIADESERYAPMPRFEEPTEKPVGRARRGRK